jgi:hypothetical protein
MYLQGNIQTYALNYCCRGTAISSTYSVCVCVCLYVCVCVSVVLDIQHAKRMCCNTWSLWSVWLHHIFPL